MSATRPLLVLIGPAATGKSTVGAVVAERLRTTFVDLDAVGEPFYREVGWSLARLVERVRAVGRVAAEREWESARAHAVARAMATSPGAVVALGAGHASYTDPQHATTVRNALAGDGRVVLLLPSLDRYEALTQLRQRSLSDKGTDWVRDGHDFLAQWYDEEFMREIATDVVVSGGRAPAATADDVLTLIQTG
ncbi:shikimate kinase [Xylanimonas ulmi]|uniref:Shikimate kinase n=1 Tax=Xylanimonas ulmi TaxID=228973 RepID=A0A4Q7M342_9MICO|nr:shikimate kinase [Xylanibacterium ulmi]RZS61042.1 shikimate kinase [Xylanibacterium ulmi]